MKRRHFDLYLKERFSLEAAVEKDEEIIEGRLSPIRGGGPVVPIRNGIPRFVDEKNYSNNFGFQWNNFRLTQLDSHSGVDVSTKRLWGNSRWTPSELSGKRVLEVGSGAGRFTELLLGAGARLVSFDFSSAIEANYANNKEKGDCCFFQGNLYEIPFEDGYFDYVLCYGVLQHTPDPDAAFRAIFRKLKPGGKISIDHYKSSWLPSPFRTPKYLWRPITKRMKPEKLLKIIQAYVPFYLPIDTAIRSIPKLGPLICALIPIPCWNYLKFGLSQRQRLEWAILDTFDALGAAYDYPKTLGGVRKMITIPESRSIEVFYGGTGIVANLRKDG
jgi:ubiquinone/menaquinone biosynthesis C-methylase UbiE